MAEFEEIKKRRDRIDADERWLIAEVERLRAELARFVECNKDPGPAFHLRFNCRRCHYHKEGE